MTAPDLTPKGKFDAEKILDALRDEHGDETWVASGYAYYESASKAFGLALDLAYAQGCSDGDAAGYRRGLADGFSQGLEAAEACVKLGKEIDRLMEGK